VERTEQVMLSLALDFGATMSDDQMAEFIANLWERQRDYEKEFLGRSEAEYRQDSYENLLGFLQRFVGRLDTAQEDRLRAAVDGLSRFDEAWLDERALWLQTLEPLLQREPGWAEAVRAAYSARKITRTPKYKAYLGHNLDVINHAVADILNQLDARQRKRLANELEDLRRRLRKLADRPQVAAAPAPAGSVARCLANQVIVKANGLQVDIDRHMLVDAMDVPDGSRIRRNRQEPIHVGREPVEVPGVGAAAHHVGRYQRICIHGANGARENLVAA
jgi:hypothetical protein